MPNGNTPTPPAQVTGRRPFSFTLIFLGLILVLVALGYLVLTVLSLKTTIAKIEYQTKSVGTFPNNLDSINRILSGTKDRLMIAVDFAGYGEYSYPAAFEKYAQLLKDLSAKDVEIAILLY